MRVPTSQWAWGTSAHWQLYYTLRAFSRKFVSVISTRVSENSNFNPEENGIITASKRHSFQNDSQSDLSQVLLRRKRRQSACYKLCSRNSSSISTSDNSVADDGITEKEVNHRLWENENTVEVKNNLVKICVTNQLASNQPNEDQIFITESLHDNGVVIGVLDGHGGSAFAEHAKIRLPYYLHAALLDRRLALQNRVTIDSLFQHVLEFDSVVLDKRLKWEENVRNFLQTVKEDFSMIDNAGNIMSYISNPLRNLFGTSVVGSYEEPSKTEVSLAIKDAFLQLDGDITSEIHLAAETKLLDDDQIPVALSGCCALVAYISNDELYVANLGDCRAVLGSFDLNGWSAVQLTQDHTAAANPTEVKRIISEHPSSEQWSCIQYGRLLGRLAPLRALGDIQFKLPSGKQEQIFKGVSKYNPMKSLRTPPYLSAEPEVFNYKIEKNDKFIVIASDGLWDMLSNEEVVEIVAAYIEGHKIDFMKERALFYGVANAEEILSDPNAFQDTVNENVASFLIRFALGGYDRNNLRMMLSMSYPDVRLYRDDITVAVVFLDNASLESL